MRQRARTDSNHAAILAALRQTGATIVDLSKIGQGVPDALVSRVMPCPCCGARYPQNVLVEIKTAAGKLNARQVEFHAMWRGPICVIHSVAEALKIIGVEA